MDLKIVWETSDQIIRRSIGEGARSSKPLFGKSSGGSMIYDHDPFRRSWREVAVGYEMDGPPKCAAETINEGLVGLGKRLLPCLTYDSPISELMEFQT